MNRTGALLLAAFATTVLANPAAAFQLTPTGTSFYGPGALILTQNSPPTGAITCAVKIRGRTNNIGQGRLISVELSSSNGGGATCAAITATGLSWHVHATGSGSGVILNVGFTGGQVGTCALASVAFSDTAGAWTISPTPLGTCTISGTLTTIPAINAQ